MGEQHHTYEFGPFCLDAQKRLLLRADEPIKLYPKEFEMLLALVERGGDVVDKDDLLRRVWPDSTVEEGNLTTYVSHLRKALGETRDQHEYIVTVPGQGYRFVARIKQGFDEVIVHERTRTEVTVEEEVERETAPATGVSDPKASHPNRRRITQTVLFALLLAGVIGIVGFYQSRLRQNDRQAELAPVSSHVRRFATHGGVPIRGSISPDGKSLVYVQRINGQDSLWLGQTESNTSVRISQQTDLTYGEATFAPDGRSLYFTVRGDNRPRPVLVRQPVLGGVMTELIPDVHSPVTLSPNGKQLAFVRADEQSKQTSIIIADAVDGGNERTVATRQSHESLSTEGISWSPDAKSIAFSAKQTEGQEEICVISIADGSLKKIGGRGWGRIGNLAWLPDSSGVAMIAREDARARRAYIWFVPYPSGDARKITNDVNLYLMNSLSVSADGKLAVLHGFIHSAIWVAPDAHAERAKLVLQGIAPRYEGVDGLTWTQDARLLYTAYVGDNLAIWSMDSAGAGLRQLTVNSETTVDSQMCGTADGRYVVFQSNRTREVEIWRANADGSGLKQLTTGGGNSLPSVSPDSRWVVYNSTRGGNSALFRISIDGGEVKQLTDRPASWAQVSPDGKYVAYTESSQAAGVRLIVIPFEGGELVKSFAVPKTAWTGRRVMRWMPDGKAIIYRDGSQGLWRQVLEEEKPQPVRGFEELHVHNLAWSFDGKSLAYATGPVAQEILLLERFK